MAGPPPRGTSLLQLLEPGWRRHLSAGGLAGTLEVETAVRDTVARALGDQSRGQSPTEVAHQWPACLVVGLAQVAAASYRNGRFWPGWHRAAGLRATRRSADQWGQAFVEALTLLGITAPGTGWEAVLVHAAVPDACLPEFLRLVAAGFVAGGGGADADLPGTDPAVAVLLRSGGSAVTSFVEHCRSTLRLLTAPAGRRTATGRPAISPCHSGSSTLPRSWRPNSRAVGRRPESCAWNRSVGACWRLTEATRPGGPSFLTRLPIRCSSSMRAASRRVRFCPPSRSGWCIRPTWICVRTFRPG